jgi:hypothetical protein
MVVYKIFPEKDAFIWSEQQTQNMGRDEILEVSTYNDPAPTEGNLSEIPSVTRALVKFPQSQIDSLLDNVINIDHHIDNYNFEYGLKHNYIVDYNVYIPSLSITNISEYSNGIEVPVELSELNNIDNLLQKVLFLFTGMLKTGSRKCIVYMGTKEQCKQFNELFEYVGTTFHGISTWSKMIIDDTNIKERVNIINEFQTSDRSTFCIITSCGCLDEAVDIEKGKVWTPENGGCEGINHKDAPIVPVKTIHRNHQLYKLYNDVFPFISPYSR